MAFPFRDFDNVRPEEGMPCVAIGMGTLAFFRADVLGREEEGT